MTFEEWEERVDEYVGAEINGISNGVKLMYADWKAERDFYLPQNQDLVEANNSMGPKMIKLIEALERLLVFEDDHDACGTEWHDAQKLAVEHARAVLKEVQTKEE